ncbi:MAG: hypothetical protein MI723_18115 [Caulobacterales bacterium]|nr:hypothetical protein [Caulobacterales bacterium]
MRVIRIRSAAAAAALAAGLGLASAGAETERVVFTLETDRDLIAMTHGGQIPLTPTPPGVRSLEGTGADRSLVLAGLIRDESGEVVGVASELEYFPQPEEEGAKPPWDTYWTLVILGRGALFAAQQENIPAEHAPAFAAAEEGEGWTGSILGRTTVGPGPDGAGVVLGGDGEFAGARGTFVETVDLRAVTADGGIVGVLSLTFDLER